MSLNLEQHTMKPRTRLSHPLLIATVPAGPGAIGITFCPGIETAAPERLIGRERS